MGYFTTFFRLSVCNGAPYVLVSSPLVSRIGFVEVGRLLRRTLVSKTKGSWSPSCTSRIVSSLDWRLWLASSVVELCWNTGVLNCGYASKPHLYVRAIERFINPVEDHAECFTFVPLKTWSYKQTIHPYFRRPCRNLHLSSHFIDLLIHSKISSKVLSIIFSVGDHVLFIVVNIPGLNIVYCLLPHLALLKFAGLTAVNHHIIPLIKWKLRRVYYYQLKASQLT